jgi:hypothetical protein
MSRNAVSPKVSLLVEAKTRFLFPFLIGELGVLEATQRLLSVSDATFGVKKSEESAWIAEPPPHSYRDELMPHVRDYFFATEATAETCAYLRLADKPTNRIFRNLVATLREKTSLPVELVRPGCEVFLAPQGLGVLALTLVPQPEELTPELVMDFNYLGAGRFPGVHLLLTMPHPSEDKARWSALTEGERLKIKPAPALDAPIGERAGVAGGRYTLGELAAYLLEPLCGAATNDAPASPALTDTPCVYTVVRCSHQVDFGREESRAELGPLVSALAQVEEPLHAGAVPGHVDIPHAFLNRKHWAASSQMGSAHIVADQPPDETGHAPEFNHERVGRVLNKYFVPYLAALFQRLMLQRALHEAARVLAPAAIDAGAVPPLEQLRGSMLRFAVSGHFTQVSTRHAVHRYYQLAREALDVEVLWREVRQAIADLDAHRRSSEGSRLSASMDQSLKAMVRMQRAIHSIEAFVVSVYAVHLTKMAIESVHPLLEPHHAARYALELLSLPALAVAAVAGFILTRRFVSREEHKEQGKGR